MSQLTWSNVFWINAVKIKTDLLAQKFNKLQFNTLYCFSLDSEDLGISIIILNINFPNIIKWHLTCFGVLQTSICPSHVWGIFLSSAMPVLCLLGGFSEWLELNGMCITRMQSCRSSYWKAVYCKHRAERAFYSKKLAEQSMYIVYMYSSSLKPCRYWSLARRKAQTSFCFGK